MWLISSLLTRLHATFYIKNCIGVWLILLMMPVLLLVIEFAERLSTAVCTDVCDLHLPWLLSKQVFALRQCAHNPSSGIVYCASWPCS